MYTRSKLLHIKLAAELLEKIDEAARASFQSRSSFIRESIAIRLNSQSVIDHRRQQEELQNIIEESARAAAQDYI